MRDAPPRHHRRHLSCSAAAHTKHENPTSELLFHAEPIGSTHPRIAQLLSRHHMSCEELSESFPPASCANMASHVAEVNWCLRGPDMLRMSPSWCKYTLLLPRILTTRENQWCHTRTEELTVEECQSDFLTASTFCVCKNHGLLQKKNELHGPQRLGIPLLRPFSRHLANAWRWVQSCGQKHSSTPEMSTLFSKIKKCFTLTCETFAQTLILTLVYIIKKHSSWDVWFDTRCRPAILPAESARPRKSSSSRS